MTKPDVLVLGASGLIGRSLVNTLHHQDVEITATYRSNPPAKPLRDWATWKHVDILDKASLQQVIPGHTRVYHLAGASLQDADPETVRRVNARGTKAVIDSCLRAEIERVAFASTAGTRRSTGAASEADVARPVGAYQESKAAAERVVDAATSRGLETVTVHPTSVFGPGDEAFTGRLLRMASDRKLFAHPPGGASIVGVKDVAQGTMSAMRQGCPGEHYLLGGENLRYREALRHIAAAIDGHLPPVTVPSQVIHGLGPIAERLGRLTGRHVFPFTTEMARLATQEHYYDCQKATEALGYTYRPFEELIGPAWSWFQSNDEIGAPDEERVNEPSIQSHS